MGSGLTVGRVQRRKEVGFWAEFFVGRAAMERIVYHVWRAAF